MNTTKLTFHISPKYSSTSGFMEWIFERRGSLKPHRTSWTVRFMNTSMPRLFMYIETKVRKKKEYELSSFITAWRWKARRVKKQKTDMIQCIFSVILLFSLRLVCLGLIWLKFVCSRYQNVTTKLRGQWPEVCWGHNSMSEITWTCTSTVHVHIILLCKLAAAGHNDTHLSCADTMSYHKWDVDSPDDVNLWVTSWLLRHKHKSFGVKGVNLGAVLQESHVFPRPVLPSGERTMVS